MFKPIHLEPGPDGSMLDLIARALARWSGECARLQWLPEHRYDREMFPTCGQYDWFSAVVLYSLVRELRPARVLEFSTSSGYSTCFTASALEANGEGVVETVDIDAAAIPVARERWAQLGVARHIQFHQGDCRAVIPRLLDEGLVDLLFIDTLHSADMAEWYLEHIIPRLQPETPVHIHDVMPPEAQVRIHGGPPWPHLHSQPIAPLARKVRFKRWLWHALRGRRVPPPAPSWDVIDWRRVETEARQNYFDGNYFDEARLLRALLSAQPAHDVVYLHRLERLLKEAHPELQQYAEQDQIGRSATNGVPLEWNDAVWLKAATVTASTRHRIESFQGGSAFLARTEAAHA
jgi:predicted O-methyltransferase YrrM